jgi:bifunctional DNA-binding transcriptional regulator/antitoxin component of YhaV-PrlF toxin-antitoxin module
MEREYAVVLSSKGQLTLPAEVRRALDVDRGARLRLICRADGVVELVKPRFSRIAEVAGIGKAKPVDLSPTEMRDAANLERLRAKIDRSE